jgi:hypothetical protein
MKFHQMDQRLMLPFKELRETLIQQRQSWLRQCSS